MACEATNYHGGFEKEHNCYLDNPWDWEVQVCDYITHELAIKKLWQLWHMPKKV